MAKWGWGGPAEWPLVRGGMPPPLCPGQLLPWSQGLKPEPLGGGGAATPAGAGRWSGVGAGLLGSGVPGARPFWPGRSCRNLLHLGKVTHQLVIRLRRRGSRGSRRGGAQPRLSSGIPSSYWGKGPPRDPQSGRADIQSGWSPHPRQERGAYAPQLREVPPWTLEIPRSPRRPPTPGSEFQGHIVCLLQPHVQNFRDPHAAQTPELR